MLETDAVFEILPIKPSDDLDQIEDIINDEILFRYHPDNITDNEPEKLKEKLKPEYREICLLATSTLTSIKRDPTLYMDEEDYEDYKSFFKDNLNTLNKPDLTIILDANGLPTNGNKQQLIDRILENVPSAIAVLNLKEHDLRKECTPDIEETLKEFPNNKLVRILELKNIDAEGDKMSLINQIKSHTIDEDEINNLINQVDDEISNLRGKLGRLKESQLKLILENNNLDSNGRKNQLITKIIKNLPISEIENNINKVRINKQKAIKKLYSITGKDKLSDSFKTRLFDKNLEIHHGIEIRDKIVSLINNYQIEEKNIQSKITELINEKSQQIIDDTINYLYKLTGKKSVNSKFLKKLNDSGLDRKIGTQIKNEVIVDIKDGKVQKDNLSYYINLKIKQKKLRLQNEKIDSLYEITGKTTFKSSFKKLLSEHDLDEQDGLKIQDEIINIIKTTNIDKKDINSKLNEVITLKASEKLLKGCNINYLNQIAIINDLSKQNSKQKYIEYFLNNISSSFNDLKIKSDIHKIDAIKEDLSQLYKNQLEFILTSNDMSSEGVKKELINKILSNIPIIGINLVISEIKKVNKNLSQLSMNELSFILKENNIIVSGTKTNVINEINKKLSITTIKTSIKKLNELKSKLTKLNINELKFIAKSNNLVVEKDKNQLIDIIETQIPLEIIAENILEISNLKDIVKSFNNTQRQHLIMENDLNSDCDDETQIKNILENVDLYEIAIFNKKIITLKNELNNLSVIQLNSILNNHNLETSDDKPIQIETILENILIPLIKKDIRLIKKFENEINALSEDEIDNILSENKFRKSIDKKENIKTLLENLSFEELRKYLSKNNKSLIENLKESTLICPIIVYKGKKTFTTETKDNSILLLLFKDEKLFNEHKLNNPSTEKLEKDLEYFKKVINKNKKIEGILVKKTTEDLIIKKNQLT